MKKESIEEPTPGMIRALRLKNGHTRKEAADLVLHTARAWEGWELGERKMHPAIWWLYRHGGCREK